MKLSPDVYFAGSDSPQSNAFDSRPDQLLTATDDADKVIVFGIKAPFCGINADQELIAGFVKEHSDRFIGWCSVDPNDADCVDQLEHYVNNLGLRGLKCSPIYQNWDPQDPNLYANISALHYRPLRHYQALMTAMEYGVEHKLIFGSDFPSATLPQVIAGQHKVNDIICGTNFPRIPDEMIHNIIYENRKRFLPEYA